MQHTPLFYYSFSGCFAEWQLPLMEQVEQPQPQEVFPFFLLRIIPAIIAATAASKTAQMMIVAKFSMIHASILIPPEVPYAFTGLVSLTDSL